MTAIAATVIAVALFAAFVLLGAYIDGRRQALRNRGLHPVTTPKGHVRSQESSENQNNTHST